MATFIEEVARKLYEQYGDDIASLTLVLPSKRARLFFAESLSKVAVRPVWEPQYTSIDDLMCRLADMRKGDRLRLVAELHKVYSKYHKETFDEFYHWGEVLLSDFDMVDKYRVDATQLFSNIRDLKEIESDMSYLSEEQIAMINRFWRTVTGDESGVVQGSEAKSKFLAIWRSLGDIYTEFRAALQRLGVGYTGMIYRQAADMLDEGRVSVECSERYIFIGFNALSECEKSVLKHLQSAGQAEFYWDYDNYYVDGKFQEAGMFIRENLRTFADAPGISHDNFRNLRSVKVLSASSNVAQCQSVVEVLEQIAAENGGVLDKRTAVVLTDENMLMPLLYALPEKFKVRHEQRNGKPVEIPSINVTMGYPVRNTLAYSFVERLLELQKHARGEGDGATFYHTDVDGILSHPYISDISTSQFDALRRDIVKHRLFQVPRQMVATTPLLQRIFRRAEGWSRQSEYLLDVIDAISLTSVEGSESAYRAEFLATISAAITKLKNVAERCEVELSDATYRSLVRRHLQAERVPFTGEPLQGLQIMGILETRNLDFENVVLLSMTDQNFPGSRATDKSFLPYGLRYGFNIPTAEHHEGVYAYYFYRLIERANRLYMLYSSAADDKSTGEPSRYIRQLEYETDIAIEHGNVGVEVSLAPTVNIEVEKSDEVFEKLLRFTRERTLSPTAFSTYVKCPLRFYFNAVERLRPEDELEESVDNMTFGNIFHEAADMLYSQIKGDADAAVRLEQLRNAGEVERCVDRAIAKIYFQRENEPLPELGGELTIIRNIVREYLGSNLLDYDIAHCDFVVDTTEGDVDLTLPIEVAGERFEVRLAGRADRIDSLGNGMLRVIDYKTGTMKLEYKGVAALFHGEKISEDRESNIINTLLYAMMLSHKRGRDVRPELYYVGKMIDEEYSPRFIDKSRKCTLDAYSDCRAEFEAEVCNTLCEMFDRTVPFRQCEDTSACSYCDYRAVCSREKRD